MALTKQEAEIPLNGGMDVKQSSELQDVTTLRAVENLRWNALGELEKRPTYDDNLLLSAPADNYYSVSAIDTIFGRGGEVCALTSGHGLVRTHEGASSLQYNFSETSVGVALGGRLMYAPQTARVSRKFLQSAQFSDDSRGILIAVSAVHDGVLAVGWYEVGTGMHFRAYNLETGSVVASSQVDTSVGISMAAIEYTEPGKEGVLFAYSLGVLSPITITTVRYDAATNAFVTDSNLTTNALTWTFAIEKSGTSMVFAFTDNTTGFLKAQLRTVGSVAQTHNGTIAAVRHAIVVGTNATLLVSQTASDVYAEKFGTPAGVTSVMTAAVGFDFEGVSASLEGSAAAVITVNAKWDQLSAPAALAYLVYNVRVDFSGAPTAGTVGYLPNAWGTGTSFTHDGRSYHVFALANDISDDTPTSAIVARAAYPATGGLEWDPVARICHDRFFYGDTISATVGGRSSSVVGDDVYMVMLADPSIHEAPNGDIYPQTMFLSKVTLGGLAQSIEVDNVATVSTGLLWDWDGVMTSESQALHRPRIEADSTNAGTTTLTTGISLVAVYRWVDASGREHRSAPSNVVDFAALANVRLDIYVSRPPFAGFDRSQSLAKLEVDLYATEDGGSTYYLAGSAVRKRGYDNIVNQTWYYFEDIDPGNPAAPQLYSTGDADDELVSEPPPAMRSIARISDRIWGVDAEDTSRIWFTKPLVSGYAPEWNTACTLTIGDDCVAITDVNGVPTVLAKTGIWQVYGEGPNSLGAGSFAPARKLPHQVECFDPTAVCKTPQGVMFRGRRGLYLLGTGLDLQPIGLPIDPETRIPETTPVRLVYDETHSEVRVISNSAEPFVYNLLEGKWSSWPNDEATQYQVDACVVGGSVWYVHLGSGPTYRIRREMSVAEAGYRTSAQGWRLQTPKIKFAGVTGDVRVWELIVQVDLGSTPSNIDTLQVSYDTPDGTDTFSWTGAELAAMLPGEGNVVDLRCQVRYQKTKSFYVTIEEMMDVATSSGTKPIAMRVIYGVTPGGVKRVKAGARKGAGS